MKRIMRKVVVAVICFVFFWLSVHIKRDYRYYVCEGYLDYYLPALFNPRCTYNSEICELPPRIIAQNGFKVREYKVETDDGFILDVIRISESNETTAKGVIYLQHAYTCDSHIFVDKGKNMSLGLLLADKGYDVWMGNSRGTRLSLDHKTLTTRDPKYWDYSFHEIAIYDIPASLRLIKKITKVDKITYIGYSGGATAALIYASLLKNHAKNTINLFITITPGSYMHHITFPFWFFSPAIYFMKFLADTFGEENNIRAIAAVTRTSAYYPIILTAVTDMFQFTPDQKHAPWMPLVACGIYQSVNSKQVMHYVQMERAKNFQQYDYGAATNQKIYGRKRPPEYPVSKIDVPFQIVYSASDAFFGCDDAWLLYNKMRGVARKHKPYNAGSFNHIDFMYGKRVGGFYKWIIEKVDTVNTIKNNSVD